MKLDDLKTRLAGGELDTEIRRIYAADSAEIASTRERLAALIERFEADFGEADAGLFSAPGRT
ncbi:MAG: hypothetical protein KDB34_02075, partial [Propionibacteriaceae bacterium]|nr:hypothetical protein [Propionibacteriaceae bacterium]